MSRRMPRVERVTIDVTVVRDILGPATKRPRHPLAQELCRWAQAGDVELAVAPQGHRLDVNEEPLVERLRAKLADEGIAEAPQLAYLSPVTYPSPDLAAGSARRGLRRGLGPGDRNVAIPRGEAAEGRHRFHVETHVMAGRDVFVTDDGPLLAMCRRLRDEHNVPVTAMRLEEYVDARRP